MLAKRSLILFCTIAAIAVAALLVWPNADKLSWLFKSPEKPKAKFILGRTPLDVFVASSDLTINLAESAGKSFKLTGEVWLSGPSLTSTARDDRPDGFHLYLREFDSLHRYEACSRFLRDKRRPMGGTHPTDIVPVSTFSGFPLHQWLPFSLVATPGKITFTFGQSSGEIPGPLEMDGTNSIGLALGTKLRNVQLEVLGDGQPQPK